MKSFFIILAILGLWALSSSDTPKPEPATTRPASSQIDYSSFQENEPDPEPEYFNGYECTDDCSGHEAGYNWAEEKGITDPDDCGGNSNSFIEGCQSYAEEN